MMNAHLLDVLVADRRRDLEMTARRWRLSRQTRGARRLRRSKPAAEVITMPSVINGSSATDRRNAA